MKIAIHQPEHFPYEGFFQKMQAVDLFIVLDNVKFNRRNFQHRNRIKNHRGTDEWFGMQVPRESKHQLINQVTSVPDGSWRVDTIKYLKREVNVDTAEIYKHLKLVDINMASIKWCMVRMGIETPIVMASELNVKGHKSELLANIVRAVDGREYISGSGGRDYLNNEYFGDIKVTYFEPVVDNYYSMLYNLTR